MWPRCMLSPELRASELSAKLRWSEWNVSAELRWLADAAGVLSTASEAMCQRLSSAEELLPRGLWLSTFESAPQKSLRLTRDSRERSWRVSFCFWKGGGRGIRDSRERLPAWPWCVTVSPSTSSSSSTICPVASLPRTRARGAFLHIVIQITLLSTFCIQDFPDKAGRVCRKLSQRTMLILGLCAHPARKASSRLFLLFSVMSARVGASSSGSLALRVVTGTAGEVGRTVSSLLVVL